MRSGCAWCVLRLARSRARLRMKVVSLSITHALHPEPPRLAASRRTQHVETGASKTTASWSSRRRVWRARLFARRARPRRPSARSAGPGPSTARLPGHRSPFSQAEQISRPSFEARADSPTRGGSAPDKGALYINDAAEKDAITTNPCLIILTSPRPGGVGGCAPAMRQPVGWTSHGGPPRVAP